MRKSLKPFSTTAFDFGSSVDNTSTMTMSNLMISVIHHTALGFPLAMSRSPPLFHLPNPFR